MDLVSSYFRILNKYHDDADSTVTEKPSLPGYWDNRDEGCELLTPYPLATSPTYWTSIGRLRSYGFSRVEDLKPIWL